MAENAVVRSRISAEVKDQATAVLAAMGLTVSDVMRILLTRIAKEGALPFELNPYSAPREALPKRATGKEVPRAKNAGSLEELFDQLGI